MWKYIVSTLIKLNARVLTLPCLIFFLLAFQSDPAFADSQLRTLDIKSGLPANWIRAIFRDSQGFMWFGSWEGLIRYDGESFKVFKNDPREPNSLSNNIVSIIVESEDGNLWLGTVGGGLVNFDTRTEIFTAYNTRSGKGKSLSSDVVVAIQIAKDGKLWVGTWGGGLNLVDPKTGTVTTFLHDPHDAKTISGNYITGIQPVEGGALWLLTRSSGINRLDTESGAVTRLTLPGVGEGSHWGQNTIARDRDGDIWFVSRNYLHHLNTDTQTINSTQSPDPAITLTGLLVDDKRLWVHGVGQNSGLYEFNIIDKAFKPHSLSAEIFGGYLSLDGVGWFGTRDRGIQMLDLRGGAFKHLHQASVNESGYEGDTLRALHVDSNNLLWILTKNAITSYNPANQSFNAIDRSQFRNRGIEKISEFFSVTKDAKENLWLGSTDWQKDQGLIRMNLDGESFKQYLHDATDASSISSNSVLTGLLDTENRLWFGTDFGLNLYDAATDSFVRFYPNPENTSDPVNNIRALTQTEDGLIWTGSWYGGMHVFDPTSLEFVNHYIHDRQSPHGLSSDAVYSIVEGDDYDLWLGTANGLNRLDRTTGNIEYLTSADGLPSDAVLGVIKRSKNEYWISTRRGLSQFNSKLRVFQNYDRANGLIGDEFLEDAYAVDAQGNMYFGTTGGVNVVSKVWSAPPVAPANATISSISLKHQPLDVSKSSVLDTAPWFTDAITLPKGENSFSLELVPRHYQSVNKIRYKYLLSPLENKWVEVDSEHRNVSYTNLDPGEYEFKYSASDNLGRWPRFPDVNYLQITVHAPWWATTRFRLYFAALLAAIAVLFYVRRQSNLRAKLDVQSNIRESEERLRLLLNSTSQAFFGVDVNGHCKISNAACAKLLGVEKSESLIGQNMECFFVTENVESFVSEKSLFAEVVRIDLERSVESAYTVFVDRRGRVFPVEFSTHVLVENGAISGCVVNFSDATRKLEQARQIQRAQKSEMIGNLVDGIVHDFNNNLNVMAMNIQMLELELEASSQITTMIGRINSSLNNASDLSKRLMNLSISNQLTPKVIVLNTVVSHIYDVVAKTLGEGITVETVLSPHKLVCRLDLENLQNVILNLVLNASEAIESTGHIVLTTEYKDTRSARQLEMRRGEYAVMTVSDNGCGIATEIRARIFEPFVTTKSRGNSSGLGLAIVQSFVQQSSGFIKIESAKGKGTSFSLYFPMMKDVVTQESVQNRGGDDFVSTSRGETILVVEDDSNNLESLCQLLRKAGYKPIAANSVDEAIQKFEENQPKIDLLLSDIVLPSKADGRDLYIDLSKRKPGLAVIFVTGYAQSRDDRRFENIPTLQKPLRPDKLLEAIGKVLV